MSLDNVIALVSAANGNFTLLIIGLATTIPLVIYGAALLTSLLDRFPILVYLGAGLLVYIAVEMSFKDKGIHHYVEPYVAGFEWLIGLGAAAAFIAVTWLWQRRRGGGEEAEET
jgi:predicted tellurium resistance membrane protein TerC